MTWKMKDKNGKTILKIKNGKILIARFTDMGEEMKDNVSDIYVELTGNDKQDIKSFLNYDEEKFEFCS